MERRTAVAVVIGATFVMWMGTRATAIALPLVALQQTGHTWSTGLVLGAQAVPLGTVGWWGARLRERMTGGRAIAGVLLIEAAGLAIVPVSAALGRLSLLTLSASGLVVGAATALEAPGLRALLADVGDAIGPGRAARYLAWQDFAHRAPMFLAPPLGALAVARGHADGLLWAECAAFAAAAALVVWVRAAKRAPDHVRDRMPPATSIRTVLRAYPRMTASITVNGTITLTWFAFSLGLAVLGAQTHRPGVLIAAGMFGYGLASTVVAVFAPLLVNRLPAWPTAVVPALVLGATYVVLPHVTASVPAIVVLAAIGGAAMPVGIAAHNRLLSTEPSAGPDRRAAFSADAVTDGCGAAVGMLGGGVLLGLVGVPAAMVGSGTAQLVITVAALGLVPVLARRRVSGRGVARSQQLDGRHGTTGRPAGEQLETVVGGRAGVGGVDVQS